MCLDISISWIWSSQQQAFLRFCCSLRWSRNSTNERDDEISTGRVWGSISISEIRVTPIHLKKACKGSQQLRGRSPQLPKRVRRSRDATPRGDQSSVTISTTRATPQMVL